MRSKLTHLPLGILALVLLFGMAALAACGGSTPADGQAAGGQMAAAAPAGDPAQGEQIFKTGDCVACHTTTDQKLVGPGLKGVMDGKGPYGDKLPNGKPMDDKNMTEWIKIGGVGKLGQMPGHPDLSADQLANLVAYLRTLK
jgi:mono/diheme cytochrome c family protein